MTEIKAVVQAIDDAEAGSRALDCLVALAIGGFFIQGEQYGEPAYCYKDAAGATVGPGQAADMLVPRYTTDLAAALRLKEKVLPGFDWVVGQTNGGLTIHAQVGPNGMVFAKTPELAFVLGILEAVRMERGF